MARQRQRARTDASRAPGAFATDVDDFIGFLKLERGLSPNTQAGYQNDLDQCAAYLSRRGVADWRTVKGADVEAWLQSLGGKSYTVASTARKLTALREIGRAHV